MDYADNCHGEWYLKMSWKHSLFIYGLYYFQRITKEQFINYMHSLIQRIKIFIIYINYPFPDPVKLAFLFVCFFNLYIYKKTEGLPFSLCRLKLISMNNTCDTTKRKYYPSPPFSSFRADKNQNRVPQFLQQRSTVICNSRE
ncbi:unnamed protein product [Rhizopus stolonifer]